MRSAVKKWDDSAVIKENQILRIENRKKEINLITQHARAPSACKINVKASIKCRLLT
jgi:hypothetical protein